MMPNDYSIHRNCDIWQGGWVRKENNLLQELVVLILATGLVWEFLMYIWPWDFPTRLAPVSVFLLSLLLTGFFHWSIIMALASAGGVAIYHKLLGTSDRLPPRLSLRLPPRLQQINNRSSLRLERS